MPVQNIIPPTEAEETTEAKVYGGERVQTYQVVGKPAAGQSITFQVQNADTTWRTATVDDEDLVIDETNDVITFYAPVHGRFLKSASAGNLLGLKAVS